MLELMVRQLTNIGRQKDKLDENEDSKFASKSRPYFIVADGMGSRLNGKQASELAVTIGRQKLEHLFRYLKSGVIPEEQIELYLEDAFGHTNDCLNALSDNVESFGSFGTTLDMCYIHNGRAYIGHVGDSRVYHFRSTDNTLAQITKDHVEEVSSHPKYRKIHQYEAGIRQHMPTGEVEPDMVTLELNPGDMILMATDGLTDVVSDEEIARVLSEGIQGSTRKLVRLANFPEEVAKLYAEFKGCSFEDSQKKLGGKDNISLIVIEYGGISHGTKT